MLLKISKCKYIKWHLSYEQNDSMTDLFWAYLVGVDVLCAFPGIVIMDYIYKTNMYNYLMLEIVGITLMNMLFDVAFTFLEWEKDVNYAWAHGLFISKLNYM